MAFDKFPVCIHCVRCVRSIEYASNGAAKTNWKHKSNAVAAAALQSIVVWFDLQKTEREWKLEASKYCASFAKIHRHRTKCQSPALQFHSTHAWKSPPRIAYVYQYLRMYRRLLSTTIAADTLSARIRRTHTHTHASDVFTFLNRSHSHARIVQRMQMMLMYAISAVRRLMAAAVVRGISIQILLISTVSWMEQISSSWSIERYRTTNVSPPRANHSQHKYFRRIFVFFAFRWFTGKTIKFEGLKILWQW